jgi:hypothetical protein
MIATIVNIIAVIIGSLAGLLLHKKINDSFKTAVYTGIGVITLIIGFKMSFAVTRILYLALALAIGGILGNWWNIEGGILRFGNFLKNKLGAEDKERSFAEGFLSASVLFCVGAMTLIGAFKAGVEQNYELLLTKSVMDGFMAILLTSVMGIGVAFSALVILLYQGGLTLLAGVVRPLVSDLVLSELTAVGGALIIMIGLNLLDLKKIKTGNFLPALLVVLLFIALEPYIPAVLVP